MTALISFTIMNQLFVSLAIAATTLTLASHITPLPAQTATQRQAQAQGFKIAENGNALAAIVIPTEALPVVTYAAGELQWHIEKATGTRLQIVPENAVPTGIVNRIYIGTTQAAARAEINVEGYANNSFRITSLPNALFLTGKDDRGRAQDPPLYGASWPGFETGKLPYDDSTSMGSLLAVYEWLETQLDAKWLWPDESGVVLAKPTTLWSGSLARQNVKPALSFAQARLNTWAGMDKDRRPQYVTQTNVWMRRQRMTRSIPAGGSGYGHSFSRYWERFGQTHPEYFALLPRGKREPFNPKRPTLVQMCVSNPAFQQQVIADWLEERKTNPVRSWIKAAENDRTAMDPPCQCANCKAWDPANPQPPLVLENPWLSGHAQARETSNDWPRISVSDRYAKFWLAVQKVGQEHDPNATVFGLAYTEYSDPPVETKLNKNIVVGIVPAYNYPMSAEESAELKRVWDGWVATGATVYLRPNNFLTGYAMPFVYARQFGEDFRYMIHDGLYGTDFDSLVGMWGVQGINLYMMGRLTAHPDMTVDEVLNEYYSAFGPAVKNMQQYFEFWDTVSKKATTPFQRGANGGWSPLSRAGDQLYTPEAFATANGFLQQAKAAVKNDTDALGRIVYVEMWHEHARLTMAVLTAYNNYRPQPQNAQYKTAFEQAKAALDAYRAAHADKIVNVGFLEYLESWQRWTPPQA